LTWCVAVAPPTSQSTVTEEPVTERECKALFLQHADCEEVVDSIYSLFSCRGKPAKVRPWKKANAILLRSTPTEVQQMESLIKAIDVPASVKDTSRPLGRRIHIILVQHARATELVDLLRPMREGHGGYGRRIAADDRTNTIVLFATEPQADELREAIAALDVPGPVPVTARDLRPDEGADETQETAAAEVCAARKLQRQAPGRD
jgi:type II secretory pathway component GspD/PulD (secretin)